MLATKAGLLLALTVTTSTVVLCLGQGVAQADPTSPLPADGATTGAADGDASSRPQPEGLTTDTAYRVLSILGTGSSDTATSSAAAAPLAKPLEFGSSVLSVVVGFVPGQGTVLSQLLSGSATVTGSAGNLSGLATVLGSGSARASSESANAR